MGKLQQEAPALSAAAALRELIDAAEKGYLARTADEARDFMSALHHAHRSLESLEAGYSDLDLRAERARLETLDERLLKDARRMIRLLGGLQAFQAYRSQFDAQPVDRWWRLDLQVAAERKRWMQRISVLAAVLAAVAIAAYLARDILFPPNPVGDAVNAAAIQMDAGNWPGALAAIDAGLEQVPTSTELLIWKGTLLELAGEPEEAERYFERARQAAGGLAEYYLTRGQAYIRAGAFERVIANSDELLQLDPNSAEAYFLRATGYEAMGNRIEAMLDLDKSAALAQDSGNDALYAMARYRYAILMQAMDVPSPTPTSEPG